MNLEDPCPPRLAPLAPQELQYKTGTIGWTTKKIQELSQSPLSPPTPEDRIRHAISITKAHLASSAPDPGPLPRTQDEDSVINPVNTWSHTDDVKE